MRILLFLLLAGTACRGAVLDEIIRQHFGEGTLVLYAHLTSPEAERHRLTENLASADAALHNAMELEKNRPDVIENLWVVHRKQHAHAKRMLESWSQIEQSLHPADALCRFSVRNSNGVSFGVALVRDQRVDRMIELSSTVSPGAPAL